MLDSSYLIWTCSADWRLPGCSTMYLESWLWSLLTTMFLHHVESIGAGKFKMASLFFWLRRLEELWQGIHPVIGPLQCTEHSHSYSMTDLWELILLCGVRHPQSNSRSRQDYTQKLVSVTSALSCWLERRHPDSIKKGTIYRAWEAGDMVHWGFRGDREDTSLKLATAPHICPLCSVLLMGWMTEFLECLSWTLPCVVHWFGRSNFLNIFHY